MYINQYRSLEETMRLKTLTLPIALSRGITLALSLTLSISLTISCSNEGGDTKSGSSNKKSTFKIPTSEDTDPTSTGSNTDLSTDSSEIPASIAPQEQSIGFNTGKMYQCVNNTDCVIFIGEDPSSGEERPVAIAKAYLSTIHYQIASQTKTEYEGFIAICEYQTCRLKPK